MHSLCKHLVVISEGTVPYHTLVWFDVCTIVMYVLDEVYLMTAIGFRFNIFCTKCYLIETDSYHNCL